MGGRHSTHGRNLQNVSIIMSLERPRGGLEDIEVRFREDGACKKHDK
jgi:hypothetical protein